MSGLDENENKYRVEHWLSQSQIASIGYSDYWNNEETEKNKECYVLNGNFEKMETHVAQMGLVSDLQGCAHILESGFKRKINGIGIDLAAGNLWAVPHLLKLGDVDKLFCLEYSSHRLLKLGPRILDHYKVPVEKIVLVQGSFYDILLKEHSLDFVFLSQAFHHAEKPDVLLGQIKKVLKYGGIAILIGEWNLSSTTAYAKHIARCLVGRLLPPSWQGKIFNRKIPKVPLIPKIGQLIPRDPILGDHYYTAREYRAVFKRNGFDFISVPTSNNGFRSFILFNK
jgi:SAM-dependent methyltransferase